ncbi:MAG: GtrA family protein [Lachnospiraceae bacterium]|nr:GtrA family protein [Lachnospiraceae bacterium]
MKGRLGAAGSKMIAKCKELLEKYREIIIYLIVGVLTTIVSWGACFICEWLFLNPDISWQNDIINTIGWVAGVCFAYPLNRKWVFESTNPRILKEFSGFAASRLSTWILDIVIMRVTVNVLHMDYWIAKIFISAVLVMILNYVFSKLFIFRKKKPEEKED